MAALPIQNIAATGTTPSYAAATSDGDTFQNSGSEVVIFKNGASEAAKTVTFVAVGPCNHGELHDLEVTVPASGGEKHVSRLDPARYGTIAEINYSAVTNLTVAVVRG